MSSLAATIIGLVAGIPLGLEISRRQAAAEEAQRTNQSDEQARQHRARVLGLIGKELQFNERLIAARTEENNGVKERGVGLPMLKHDVWEAFSDGGELQYVQDPDLLGAIAQAYFHIRNLEFLEERYFDLVHYPGLRTGNTAPVIIGYLEKIDPPSLEAIGAAMLAIRKEAQESTPA
jgi:hypothetical protein